MKQEPTQPAFFDQPQAGPSCMSTPQSGPATITQPGFSNINQEAGKMRTPLANLANSLSTTATVDKNFHRISKKFKTEKEQLLFEKCAKYMKRVSNLRHELKKLKKKSLLNALTEENAVKKLSKKLSPTFAFMLQAQLRNCKKTTGSRWTKVEKIIALRLFKRSPTCYLSALKEVVPTTISRHTKSCTEQDAICYWHK